MNHHTIIADYRERNSSLATQIAARGMSVVYDRLDTADYLIPGGIAIERKSPSDLVTSIMDGRLFDQVHRMKEAYPKCAVIVMGDLAEAVMLAPNESVVYSSLAWVMANQVSLIIVKENEAAKLVYWLAEKAKESGPSDYRPLIRRKPKGSDRELLRLLVLTALPGVGPVGARKLLSRFGSLAGVFGATQSQLESVIGQSRAKKIYELLHERKAGTKEMSLTKFLEDKERISSGSDKPSSNEHPIS